MKIRAIRNHIIFTFEDGTVYRRGKEQFNEETETGFQIVSWDETSKKARWGRIFKVGHEAQDEFKPGMRVLIEALMWTPGFVINGKKYWRTDSSNILAVDPTTE